MIKLIFMIGLMALVSCGKPNSGGGGNPPVEPPVEVEYRLNSWYTTYRTYLAYEFGGLSYGELQVPVTRTGRVDGINCTYTTRLHKTETLNVYYLRVYGYEEFEWNVGICSELEGNYWVKLTSDTTAEFTLDD